MLVTFAFHTLLLLNLCYMTVRTYLDALDENQTKKQKNAAVLKQNVPQWEVEYIHSLLNGRLAENLQSLV